MSTARGEPKALGPWQSRALVTLFATPAIVAIGFVVFIGAALLPLLLALWLGPEPLPSGVPPFPSAGDR